MANSYLLPIFKKIYGSDFDYGNFEHRLEMQKAVYLLQDMGVPVGDYGFRWYQHGPYSQSLQDDMFFESRRQCKNVMVSKEHAERIEQLRKLFVESAHGEYMPFSFRNSLVAVTASSRQRCSICPRVSASKIPRSRISFLTLPQRNLDTWKW